MPEPGFEQAQRRHLLAVEQAHAVAFGFIVGAGGGAVQFHQVDLRRRAAGADALGGLALQQPAAGLRRMAQAGRRRSACRCRRGAHRRHGNRAPARDGDLQRPD